MRYRRVHSRLCTSLLQMPLAYWQACQQGGIRGIRKPVPVPDLRVFLVVQSALEQPGRIAAQAEFTRSSTSPGLAYKMPKLTTSARALLGTLAGCGGC